MPADVNVQNRPGTTLETQGFYPEDDHQGNFAGENGKILIDHGAGIRKFS